MRLVDATGGECPGSVLGYARALHNQAKVAAHRPGRKVRAHATTDPDSDLYIINMFFAADPVSDSVMIANANPFRITGATGDTVQWTGGTAPFTVSVQTDDVAAGSFVNVDQAIYTINPGDAREFTVMKAHELDADEDDNDYTLGWWAADDDLVDGEATQLHVGVVIEDSHDPPRTLFAPFGGLSKGTTVVYERFGPLTWTYAHLHWFPPANMVYGDPLTVGVQLNATAHVPDINQASLPGTFMYWLDEAMTTRAENVVPAASAGLPLFVSFQADDAVHYHLTFGHHHQGHGDGEIIVEKKDQSFVGGGIPNRFFYVGDVFEVVIYDYHFSGMALTLLSLTTGTMTISGINVQYDDPTPAHAAWPVTHFTVTCIAEGLATLVERLEGDSNYNEYTKIFNWRINHSDALVGDGGGVVSGDAGFEMFAVTVSKGGAVVGGQALFLVAAAITPTGGACVSGNAVVGLESIVTGAGGAVASGATLLVQAHVFGGGGGAVAGGEALSGTVRVMLFSGSGGAVAAGVAGSSIILFRAYLAQGGGVAGGVVSTVIQRPSTSAGGGVAGGAAIVSVLVVQFKVYLAMGGGVASGEVAATALNLITPSVSFSLPTSINEGETLSDYHATTIPAGLPVVYKIDSSIGNNIDIDVPVPFSENLVIYAVVPKGPANTMVYAFDSVIVKGTIAVTASSPSAATYGLDLFAPTVSALHAGATPSGRWQFEFTNAATLAVSYHASGSYVPAGSYSVVARYIPDDVAVYNQGESPFLYVVSKATPAITFADFSIQYYDTFTSAQLSATAIHNGAHVAGSWAFKYTNGSALNVGGGGSALVPGEYAVEAVFTPTDAINFSGTWDGAWMTVTPRVLYVTALSLTVASYDTSPALNYTYTPSLLGLDAFSGALSRAPGTAPGNYAINIGTLTPPAKHSINFTPGTLTILSSGLTPVTVVATDQAKTYGQPDPELTYWYDEFTTGGVTFTGAVARVAGENYGTYQIGIGTLSAGAGYTVAFVNGSFTIFKATQSIGAISTTWSAGPGNPPILGRQLMTGDTGVASVASQGGSTQPVTYTSDRPDICTVTGTSLLIVKTGSFSIRASQAGDTNYLPADDRVSPTVTAAIFPATVSSANQTYTYDGLAKTGSATTSPAGLAVSYTYNGSSAAPIDAGTYVVVANVIDPYHSGSGTWTLTINKRPQSIAARAEGNIYVVYGSLVQGVVYTNVGLPAVLRSTSVAVCAVNGHTYQTGNTVFNCQLYASHPGDKNNLDVTEMLFCTVTVDYATQGVVRCSLSKFVTDIGMGIKATGIGGNGQGLMSYEVTPTDVATVDASGNIFPIAAGTGYARAYRHGDSHYRDSAWSDWTDPFTVKAPYVPPPPEVTYPLKYVLQGNNSVLIVGGSTKYPGDNVDQPYSISFTYANRQESVTVAQTSLAYDASYGKIGRVYTISASAGASGWCTMADQGITFTDLSGSSIFVPYQAGFSPPGAAWVLAYGTSGYNIQYPLQGTDELDYQIGGIVYRCYYVKAYRVYSTCFTTLGGVDIDPGTGYCCYRIDRGYCILPRW